MSEKSVYLYCTEGGSDKEYHVHLRRRDGGWVVDFNNGPRGKALRGGTKTATPVTLAEAQAEFDKLVRAKMKGGYTENQSGEKYTTSEFAGRASGHVQQLPTSITPQQAEALLDDPAWALQEKKDGERRTVRIRAGAVSGINKLGLLTNVPESWQHWADVVGAAEIDGEQIGGTLYAFDLLSVGSEDLRVQCFSERYGMLEEILARHASRLPNMELVVAHSTAEAKRLALQRIEAANREGVVFKHRAATYDGGRSKAALKYKLVEDATFLVLARNQQRSVRLGAFDLRGQLVEVGSVTVPASADVPPVDSLLDVQYLYYNPGGALEQPVFKGLRNDVKREEATLAQITRIRNPEQAEGALEPTVRQRERSAA